MSTAAVVGARFTPVRAGRGQGSAAEPRFGEIVRDLLIERGFTTALGNPNWMAFSKTVPGLHYETLRKAVVGERVPHPDLMEKIAAALGVEPTTFPEYRLAEFSKQFDPREVGIDAALEALRQHSERNARRRS